MRQLSNELSSHISSGATNLAKCWRIKRLDGIELGFSDHDETLEFDSSVFTPTYGADSGEVASKLGAQTDSAEIVGIVNSAAINRQIALIGAKKIIRNLSRARLRFLQRLKIFSTFGRGWKRRVVSVEYASLKLAENSVQFLPNSNSKPTKRKTIMNMLNGYKTYIMGAMMLLAAFGQMAGVDLPGFDGQSATELMLQAFAFIFLRKGIKSGV